MLDAKIGCPNYVEYTNLEKQTFIYIFREQAEIHSEGLNEKLNVLNKPFYILYFNGKNIHQIIQ